MGKIDLTINKTGLAHNIQKASRGYAAHSSTARARVDTMD